MFVLYEKRDEVFLTDIGQGYMYVLALHVYKVAVIKNMTSVCYKVCVSHNWCNNA